MLDKNIKIVRITAYLKRWWNKDVKEARRTLGRASRAWGRRGGDPEEFKQARNAYRRALKRAKRECWSQFLLNDEDDEAGP